MSRAILFVSALTSFSVSMAALPSAKPDLGGVTFDFASASGKRFQLDVPKSRNLFTGKSSGEGGFEAVVALPDDQGGEYVLSCRYRMSQSDDYRHEGHSNGGCVVSFDNGGRRLLNFLVTAGDWYPYVRTVSAPKGAREMRLHMKMHKDGRLKFKDLAVVKGPKRPECEIRLAVHGQLDSTYALPAGQCALVTFVSRRAPDARFDVAKMGYRVTLPKGVRFVDCSCGSPGSIKTERRRDGSTVTTFAKKASTWIARDWDIWDQNGILVETSSDMKTGVIGEGSIAILCEGRQMAVTDTIRFLSVPPIPKVNAPKRYFNGIDYGCSTSRRFNSRESKAAYARFLSDCGVKGMIAEDDDRSTYDIFHQNGVERLFPSFSGDCANGYMLSRLEEIPEDVRFVAEINPDDSDYKSVKFRSICPIAAYTGAAWFKNDYAKKLSDYLSGADGMWANWEPYMFINRGCFCLKCRAAFAEFLGMPESELAKFWPKGVVRKFKKEWGRFRSREHGRLVLELNRIVTAATGGEKSYGFIPGVEWADMSSCWRDENLAAQYRMEAYAGDLKWIEPWGPYAAWESQNPYFYLKYKPMAQFFAAADVRKQVDADYRPPRRPKIMAYVHGVQGHAWITQPECIAMGLDSYFFNRWGAAMVYFFPKGCDARYWRSFAEATARAGRYEDFVLDGKDVSDKVSVSTIPEYAVPCSYATRYVPWSRNASMLQVRAFDHQGARIVAAFNFWEKGEAFFDLKMSGLSKGQYRIIDENGIIYSKNRGSAYWSADELAGGVRLMVGAMRTKVFEILPKGRQAAPKSVMTRQRLDELLRDRKDELRKAADEDARYEKMNPTPPRDYMPMI